jgi:hypothetical protein
MREASRIPNGYPINRDSPTTSAYEDRTVRTRGEADASFALLPFASCFAYAPAGLGPLGDEGRRICARLKAADPTWLARLAARVWLERVARGRFAASFGARVVLVSVPGSACARGASWVGERLAWCLKEVGLAAEVWPLLQRRYAVRKSAFAPAGERPSVLEHYASFAIERAGSAHSSLGPGALAPERAGERLRLTLVDDVITRGRTLLAAAERLREAFPGAQIRAFALLRTLGRDEALDRLLDPCEGEVRWVRGDARRVP